ncbi:pre-B lymphocyte protein 3 [Dasypus novemcinctus]|uniref:pre-B lymphocyte protein 3 n=1 Tax=Dasypus novemcinctus TaxID=9361 RepID=UPI000328AB94|nr:pre-B lymphocyte protein 3 [Dasypus novemcinctus]
MLLGFCSQKALWGEDPDIWEDCAWPLGPRSLPPSQWADLHALLWSSSHPALGATQHLGLAERLRPASLPLAMAAWRLTFLLTGVVLAASQLAMARKDALLVFPGQVAQLSCTLSPGHATIKDYGVSWYQQRAGSAPRYLLYYRSEKDHHRPAHIPDRFSATVDAAHNTCILVISPVQPEDDADYYCCVGYGSHPESQGWD